MTSLTPEVEASHQADSSVGTGVTLVVGDGSPFSLSVCSVGLVSLRRPHKRILSHAGAYFFLWLAHLKIFCFGVLPRRWRSSTWTRRWCSTHAIGVFYAVVSETVSADTCVVVAAEKDVPGCSSIIVPTYRDVR